MTKKDYMFMSLLLMRRELLPNPPVVVDTPVVNLWSFSIFIPPPTNTLDTGIFGVTGSIPRPATTFSNG
jgi:hypothetical protein